MGDPTGELTQALQPLRLVLGPLVALPVGLHAEALRLDLGRQALGHVADGRRHEQAVVGLERAEADVGRELAAVLAPARELRPRTHLARRRMLEVPLAMVRMDRTRRVRHEQLDQLTGELVTGVAEEPFGLRVHEHDVPVGADTHHRVRRRFEQRAELRVGLTALGRVANYRCHQRAARGRDDRQRDLGRELGAVTTAAPELHSRPHRALVWFAPETRPVRSMHTARVFGHEQLDGLTEQLVTVVAEQPLGPSVGKDDAPAVVDGDERVRCRLEQPDGRFVDEFDPRGQCRPSPARDRAPRLGCQGRVGTTQCRNKSCRPQRRAQ